ncbi:MAG: DUF58 domain-containing protein [Planctomycetota bacterium]
MAVSSLLDEALIARLGGLEIFTRNTNVVAYESGYHGAQRGGEVEFAEYRAYTPGDDVRYIDWNVYARLGTLVTKRFGAEEYKRTHIILDASGSMGTGGKFVFGRRLAAALAAIGLGGGDVVTVSLAGDRLGGRCGPLSGRHGVYAVCAFLEQALPAGPTDLDRALAEFAARHHEPCRIILISDLLGGAVPGPGLAAIAGAERDTSVIQVLDRADRIPAERGSFRFRDAESGAEFDAEVGREELDGYRARMTARIGAAAGGCARLGIDHILLDTARPLEAVLFEDLRAQGVVRG